jgi:hypothetical protein
MRFCKCAFGNELAWTIRQTVHSRGGCSAKKGRLTMQQRPLTQGAPNKELLAQTRFEALRFVLRSFSIGITDCIRHKSLYAFVGDRGPPRPSIRMSIGISFTMKCSVYFMRYKVLYRTRNIPWDVSSLYYCAAMSTLLSPPNSWESPKPVLAWQAYSHG